MTTPPVSLDALATDLVARSGYRFTVAASERERDEAYRLRYQAVVDQGWHEHAETSLLEGRERDNYDERAVHILGWDGDTPIATGRLVLPPGSLPTEELCGIRVEPCGRVADVGRMTVARSHQSHGHPVFVALLARMYLEVRATGFEVACGLMSTRARSLMRLLRLQIEVLGEERPHWGEPRAPVRFFVLIDSAPLAARWK